MLTKLFINNYALIDTLNIDFKKDLSIITGETGAGKSILLGALGLVLGNRADLGVLKNSTAKCIIEAEFDIQHYGLQKYFKQEDLDFESQTIIRREILPSGKSRVFINDTPTNLKVLQGLGTSLIDIHSQHQTMKLSDTDFQCMVVDALATNKKVLVSYGKGLKLYKQCKKELQELMDNQKELSEKYEYNNHLFQELEEANLKVGEQQEIEAELAILNNSEEIKLNLSEAIAIGSTEDVGLQSVSHNFWNNLKNIAPFGVAYLDLSKRIESIVIELNDIVSELETLDESVQYDPTEIERLNDRLQMMYDLQKKHQVDTIDGLLEKQRELSEIVAVSGNISESIEAKKEELLTIENNLLQLAEKIHENRAVAIPKLTKQLHKVLGVLGMENAQFNIVLEKTDDFTYNGTDQLEWLLSANKGGNFGTLKKVASGGELSRIMLAVKVILSKYTKLPTIIFDEIDTGVSGDIANKMGEIMQFMSTNMQVISITHLPQIAAKGNQHYKVYKQVKNNATITHLKALTTEERIVEIAEMLEGKNASDTAVKHAKQLLNVL
ncbi:MAG: DNA repair protein RecN [Flavobacteriaceae bacterium]|nr:MAG: DNA repair protein RecN [Flavobacteriaceae bacterium]